MSNCSWILENLVVVSAFHGLVAEEVYGSVIYSAGFLGFFFEVLEAVGFVPAGREDVEGDLAAD